MNANKNLKCICETSANVTKKWLHAWLKTKLFHMKQPHMSTLSADCHIHTKLTNIYIHFFFLGRIFRLLGRGQERYLISLHMQIFFRICKLNLIPSSHFDQLKSPPHYPFPDLHLSSCFSIIPLPMPLDKARTLLQQSGPKILFSPHSQSWFDK